MCNSGGWSQERLLLQFCVRKDSSPAIMLSIHLKCENEITQFRFWAIYQGISRVFVIELDGFQYISFLSEKKLLEIKM